MTDASVHVIGPSEHKDARALVSRTPGQNVSAVLPGSCCEIVECVESRLDCSLRLLHIQVKYVFQRAMELLCNHMAIAEADERRGINDVILGKHVLLLH